LGAQGASLGPESPENSDFQLKSAILVKAGQRCATGSDRSRRQHEEVAGQNVAPAFTMKVRPGSG